MARKGSRCVSDACRRFNDRIVVAISLAELQADEIRTVVGSKKHPIWIFTTIDVRSRRWPATVVGRRSYRNTLALFQDVTRRMNLERDLLIATDAFEFTKELSVASWASLSLRAGHQDP